MSGSIFVWIPKQQPYSHCMLCPLPISSSSESFEMATMHRSSSWKSDVNNDDSLSTTPVSESVSQTCGSNHRQRQPAYREFTNSAVSENTQKGISSSSIQYGTVTSSRYRRGGHYNSYDNSRRVRHRNNDVDPYRVQQQPAQYDGLVHAHSVNGLLRQHSWSGSNASLGSNRSRSSAHDHRSSVCSRHGEDSENWTKLDEYDDNNDVTYVAAGTAPVPTFHVNSGGAGSSHSAAAPITTYAAPVMSAGAASHLPTYQPGLNLPVDQCDVRHFDQGVPLSDSAVDELTPSAQVMFTRKGPTSSRYCKDPTLLGNNVPDMQNYAARQHSQHPSPAYFRHQLESDRTALTLLGMISALQQQRQSAATMGRYHADLDGQEGDSSELSQVQLQQLQQLNTAQLISLLGTLYPGIVGRAPTGTARDDLAQQRGRGPEMGISEDILPILMQLLQQMGPINPTATVAPTPATTAMDEALLRQEKLRQLQQAAAGSWSVQPALMQQLMTQLNQMQFAQQQQQGQQAVAASAAAAAAAAAATVATVPTMKKPSSLSSSQAQLHHSTSTKTMSADTTMRPQNEYYSTVAARRPSMSGCEPVGATSKTSTLSMRHSATGATKLERKDKHARTTSTAENSAITVLPLRDDAKTPCGESGYQSESSPPLPVDSPRSISKSSSTAVACGSSKATGKPVNNSLGSNSSSNNSSGIQSFAAAAASGLSSSSSSSNATTVAATSLAANSATVINDNSSTPYVSELADTTEVAQTTFVCPPTPQPTINRGVQFEISEMDVLSEEIWHYHNSVTQSEKMLNRKLHLRDMLYYSICPVFPMCGLYVVGSSLNGFGNNTSDMDLCLMITNKDLDQKTDAVVVLNMILSTLQHTEWVSHQKLILAKVPILRIKFAAPFSDITVDLNANNSVAIKNTHLLCYYSSFDWRVRPLVSVVKEWAKRKGINDANRSSFTSYSLVLMVIHYLQCGTEPGVLPSLQQMFPRRFANKCDVRTLNVTLPLDAPATSEWHYSDKSTLGELLIGFLDYYANKFDYDRDAISVRLGKRIDRAVIARQRPNGGYQQNGTNWRSQWRCICIEEPFTYSNTAHSIYDEMVFDAIKSAFREAHQELDSTRDLKRLLNCKPIAVNAPMGGAMVYVSSFNSTRDTSSGSMTGDSPASEASRRSTPRGSSSASSISTAHSGASSSGSSSSSDYGEDQDHDRMADVSEITRVPLRQHSKSRNRRLPRTGGGANNGTTTYSSSCVPKAPQISVTNTAVTAEH
ncbi:unnamed protein product [Cylicocyclus nassatus]|uniref:polynucleotide adenylyltransferase n=1 Tax=Cylicocyclus nassatus TaxID=53992 RepID=A0AA36GPF0_CYLNA|nr:unnamed protein product [Cylicocyclus nassatus]